ncbi:Protein kinase superfamily protein [Zea mays]|uniref:Protein kinase superfamily protein n=1 Tax=Zea mays TaxID=4577 RepID=A0A1D6JEL5_MAIZE|nr:Protein kinase superfamily protein [Zea mays]AQK46244.1 Protein kinase superfamily protein [Zea mays]
MACCFLFGKKAKQTTEGDEDLHSVKVFSYSELRKATQDFSGANKIGEGGFGSVFRGVLKDGTVVAVKVLSATSRQGIREFLTELTAISDIKHENLVTLIGCCAEGSRRILVYNYLENNSLAQTLLGDTLLCDPNASTRCLCSSETWALYEQGRLEDIVDMDIGGDRDVEEACRFLKIGLLCTQDAMARRPNMTNVVRMLSGERRISVEKITRPAMISDFAELKVSSKERRPGEARSPTTAPTTKSFTTTEPFSSSETPTQSSM